MTQGSDLCTFLLMMTRQQTPAPADVTAPKLALLDGLRGWAAAWVTLNHLQHYLPDAMDSIPWIVRESLIKQGGAGVIVFFALSGYVITRSIASGLDRARFTNFYLRRIVRVTPPYYGSIVLAIAVNYVSTLVKDETFEPPTLWSLVTHIFYLPIVLGQKAINGVHWTLFLEMQFYLMIGLIMWLFSTSAVRERPRIRTCVLVIAAAASLIWPVCDLLDDFQPHFLPYVGSFLTGCFIFWLRRGEMPSWLFFGYGVGITASAVVYRNPTYITSALALWALWWACGQPKVMSRWLSDRVSQFFGEISFSWYLTHSPILGATYYLGAKLIGDSKTAQLLLVVPEVAVSIVAAFIFHRVFERRALKWSKALSRKPSQPVA